MGNYNHNNSSERNRSFKNKPEFNNRGSGKLTLYKTICSKCGKECEVPFRPSGERPVFCKECFKENGNIRRSEERNFSRPSFENKDSENSQYKEQFLSLNIKLDKILSILNAAINNENTSIETKAPSSKNAKTKEKTSSEKKKRSTKKSK